MHDPTSATGDLDLKGVFPVACPDSFCPPATGGEPVQYWVLPTINFPQGLPYNVKEAQVPWEDVYAHIPHEHITGNETKIDQGKKNGPEYLGRP